VNSVTAAIGQFADDEAGGTLLHLATTQHRLIPVINQADKPTREPAILDDALVVIVPQTEVQLAYQRRGKCALTVHKPDPQHSTLRARVTLDLIATFHASSWQLDWWRHACR